MIGWPRPTFPGGGREHEGAHGGPAHAEQVLVRELQGGERLRLQHGVEVHVAVGARAQEEIPAKAARGEGRGRG